MKAGFEHEATTPQILGLIEGAAELLCVPPDEFFEAIRILKQIPELEGLGLGRRLFFEDAKCISALPAPMQQEVVRRMQESGLSLDDVIAERQIEHSLSLCGRESTLAGEPS